MNDLELELAAALAVEEDDERVAAGRAIAWARIEDAMRELSGRRRRGRRVWIVPAIAALVVLGGGAAIAQTTGLADRLLGTTDPEPAGRIKALDDANAPGLTDAELEEVFDQGSMRESVGDRLKSDDGVIGATIVDDRGGLRLGLVRTERNGVCSILSEQRGGRWEPNLTACIGFPPGWPVNEGRSTPHAGTTLYYGVLADGVETVRFHVDGEVIEPVVANGTYMYWPRERVEPTAIDAVLEDGTVLRRDLVNDARMWEQSRAQAEFMSNCSLRQRGPETQAMYDARDAECRADLAKRFPPRSLQPSKPYVVDQ